MAGTQRKNQPVNPRVVINAVTACIFRFFQSVLLTSRPHVLKNTTVSIAKTQAYIACPSHLLNTRYVRHRRQPTAAEQRGFRGKVSDVRLCLYHTNILCLGCTFVKNARPAAAVPTATSPWTKILQYQTKHNEQQKERCLGREQLEGGQTRHLAKNKLNVRR